MAIIAALGVVVLVGLYGLKGDPEIEGFLDKPGFVSEFKNTAKGGAASADQIPALVREAKLFALRINPPPPPKPKVAPRPPTKAPPRPPSAKTPARPVPKGETVSSKYKVIATCRYDEFPDKSLALLELSATGQKWVRAGETVGHLVLQEVKDGSVVMYRNGKRDSEVAAIIPKTTSLLKTLTNTKYQAPTSSASPSPPPAPAVRPTVPSRIKPVAPVQTRPPTASTPRPQLTRPTIARPQIPTRRTSVRPSRPSIPVPVRPTMPPKPPPTPQERRQALDENIKGIEDIMNETRPGATPEQVAQEQEAWKKLLDMLGKEAKNIDGSTN